MKRTEYHRNMKLMSLTCSILSMMKTWCCQGKYPPFFQTKWYLMQPSRTIPILNGIKRNKRRMVWEKVTKMTNNVLKLKACSLKTIQRWRIYLVILSCNTTLNMPLSSPRHLMHDFFIPTQKLVILNSKWLSILRAGVNSHITHQVQRTRIYSQHIMSTTN